MPAVVMMTPIGSIRLIADDAVLVAIEKARAGDGPQTTNHPLLQKTQAQLREYFAGKRTTFDLPLAPAGTLFQQKVRAEMLKIPFGETATYAKLAGAIGTKSPRAVGQAVGANRLLVIVPCHRVVATVGLGGFAWGLSTKRRLLQVERR